MAHRNLIHNNGNWMAVIDVETTGLQPYYNDIIQVCVLPIDSDFKPIEGIIPFYCEMQPKRIDNINEKAMTVTKLALHQIMTTAMDADRTADLFEEWYEKLPLPHNKCLMPLAHNWPFDCAFMTDWLGWPAMQRYFHGHYRDLLAVGIYENDKAAFNIQPYPYPKHGLKYYCSQLKVENQRAHDALFDCLATAECYKKVVLAGAFTPVAPQPKEVE